MNKYFLLILLFSTFATSLTAKAEPDVIYLPVPFFNMFSALWPFQRPPPPSQPKLVPTTVSEARTQGHTTLGPLPPLTINGNAFSNGFQFRGVNWFGFNNKQTMVDGLWVGGSSMATDFNTIVYRLKLLGFNSVRLPFTFDDLNITPALDKSIQCLPPANIETIVASTVIPGQSVPGKQAPFFNGKIVLRNQNVCNGYLDSSSTMARFIQAIRTFIDNGFYVILDHHPNGMKNYAYNVHEYAKRWASLSIHLKGLPDYESKLKGRLLYDIMNEPDVLRLKWSARDGKPGVKDYYLTSMDYMYKILGKSALFLIEGTGQVSFNLNWGDGFVSNAEIVKKYGIDSAAPFFSELMKKSYRDNVVISPHMYGPSVSLNNRAHKGDILFQRMNESFGYLFDPGYCVNPGTCKRFPVVIGEFGSMFATRDDLDHLNDFSAYMNTRFKRSMNWLFWAYNRNSGDTGGLVKDNWLDFEWNKLQWLQKKMGLRPWYM